MGSKPPQQETYIQTPTAPTLYKSVIPETDFERAGAYLARIKAERKTAEQQRYAQLGTPADSGARQRAIQAQEASSYAASLPKGSQYDAARASAQERATKAARAPISTLKGLDPNVFNQQDYEEASKSGYSDAEIKDWLESSTAKIGPIPQQRFGLDPSRVTQTGTYDRPAPADTTPSWAKPTDVEKEAQAARDELARQERILKAKEIAKKVSEANKTEDTAAKPAEEQAMLDLQQPYAK